MESTETIEACNLLLLSSPSRVNHCKPGTTSLKSSSIRVSRCSSSSSISASWCLSFVSSRRSKYQVNLSLLHTFHHYRTCVCRQQAPAKAEKSLSKSSPLWQLESFRILGCREPFLPFPAQSRSCSMFHAATLLLSRVQASFIRWMPASSAVRVAQPQKVAFWDLEAWVDFLRYHS